MQAFSPHQRKVLFAAIYVAALLGYAIAGIMVYNFLTKVYHGFMFSEVFNVLIVLGYLLICAIGFFLAPICYILAREGFVSGYVGVAICLAPLVGSIWFEQSTMRYLGNAAQLENRIDLESLPEVRAAKFALENAEKRYHNAKSDTVSTQAARVVLAGLSLELVRIDTSQSLSNWERRTLRSRIENKRVSEQGTMKAYRDSLNAANQALEREKGKFKAVWDNVTKKYGDKSWAQVSGEKSGFDPVNMASTVMATAILSMLMAFHLLAVHLGTPKEEKAEVKKAPEPVVETKPEVVKPEYSPEFCQKYKDVDYVLRAMQLGHTTLRPIEQATVALGHKVPFSKVSSKIFPLLRKPNDPQLAKFIRDWEARSGKKVDEICKNGVQHDN